MRRWFCIRFRSAQMMETILNKKVKVVARFTALRHDYLTSLHLKKVNNFPEFPEAMIS